MEMMLLTFKYALFNGVPPSRGLKMIFKLTTDELILLK